MNITLNDKRFEVETLSYLKVFYPLETLSANKDEQPLYRIEISATDITVAYFDGRSLSLDERYKSAYTAMEGKEQVRKGKLYLKGLLYDLCQEVTGIRPPWGVLIGIRPTKLAFMLLNSLGDESEVVKQLTGLYRVSEGKARLLMQVVQAEKPYIDVLAKKHSIYIGIPFCPSRCSYCSFTSYSRDHFRDEFLGYTDLLIRELEAFAPVFEDISSIYIGGGTPTSLVESDFEKLLGTVRRLIGDQEVEFTVEAGRPDSIDGQKLEIMKRYGVNRISVNPQTTHDKTLKKIGRNHSYEDVVVIYNKARELGFDHINMDLILGLPDETAEDTHRTIERIISMAPESITVHTMALKRGTKLSEQKRAYLSDMEEKIASMLEDAQSQLMAAGYGGYYLYRQKNMVGNFENVGYCLKGKESIYNIQTMEEKESILAFGAGAISKRVCEGKIVRFDQPRDVKVYADKLEQLIREKKSFFGVS